jgi:hypothetical protein
MADIGCGGSKGLHYSYRGRIMEQYGWIAGLIA